MARCSRLAASSCAEINSDETQITESKGKWKEGDQWGPVAAILLPATEVFGVEVARGSIHGEGSMTRIEEFGGKIRGFIRV